MSKVNTDYLIKNDKMDKYDIDIQDIDIKEISNEDNQKYEVKVNSEDFVKLVSEESGEDNLINKVSDQIDDSSLSEANKEEVRVVISSIQDGEGKVDAGKIDLLVTKNKSDRSSTHTRQLTIVRTVLRGYSPVVTISLVDSLYFFASCRQPQLIKNVSH